MKFILSLLLAAVIAPTLTTSKFIMEIASASSPTNPCKDENAMIQAVIYETLAGEAQGHRALSHTRTPTVWDYIDNCQPGRCPDDLGWYCFWNCRDFAVGACWWIEPVKCADVRRGLRHGAGPTLDDVVYEEVDDALCKEAGIVTEAKMKELAKVVKSETCRAALMDDEKQYKCFDIIGLK